MGNQKIYHVYPINDLKEHSRDIDRPCWCNPRIEHKAGNVTIIHNSMDGREAYERGERKPS